ncbi:PPOX class F420-dependent oxidoreductase [Actinomadura bangladeshensis]|uniref:PPOX class F420-dependent oxidoreductase n=1 Tax=Actinomadura bangladeshensis TaxID=453573 RepID=A0A4R4NN16_9ACTN|nr:PPOX class F420-dependent oxidoreductase [Actinomadura bangladeshensis]TDC10184.1 PPOX class F420-dependent oxidoreductase [Actinomadura bangladeshensis]
MEKMTESEWRAFVMEGTRTGKAGVIRKDGSPHVTPIWFVLDGGDLLFNTSRHSVKGRVLARDPRLSVCVDDQAPPYSYVQIQAEAALVEDLDEMRRWATAIGGRYMGADRAEEFGARNAVPTEYLVRARITRVVAERAIAD